MKDSETERARGAAVWTSDRQELPARVNAELQLAHWKSCLTLDQVRGGEPATVYVALQGNDADKPADPSVQIEVVIEVLQGMVRTVQRWPMRALGVRVDFVASEITVTVRRVSVSGEQGAGIQLAAAVMLGPQPRPQWVRDPLPEVTESPTPTLLPEMTQTYFGPANLGVAFEQITFLDRAFNPLGVFVLFPSFCQAFPADSVWYAVTNGFPVGFQ